MSAIRATLLAAVLTVACISPVNVRKPGGETALLKLSGGSTRKVELLAIDSTSVYFLSRDTVWRVTQTDVAAIRVEDYSMLRPKLAVLPALVGVDVVASWLAVASFGWAWIPYASGGAIAVAALEMILSEPKVRFGPRFDEKSRGQLELYCRYMRCPTSEQWSELLTHYGQQDFRTAADTH